MKNYIIVYSIDAANDLYNLTFVIINLYKSPITAKKYITELRNEIRKLKSSGLSIPFCKQQSIIEKFGYGAKRINYKKMAIIFTISDNQIIIENIIPQSNIKSL